MTPYELRLNEWNHVEARHWDVTAWLRECVDAQNTFLALAAGDPLPAVNDHVEAWEANDLFRNVAFYGRYGAMLQPIPMAARRDWISENISNAQLIVDAAPRASGDGVAMEIIAMAAGRWGLDNGSEYIDPTALSLLGNLSSGRVRNLMAGRDAQLKSVNGKVPSADAEQWLANRPGYWPSIWHEEDRIPQQSPKQVHVPCASDGSVFHPGLRRRNGFTIGPKGSEMTLGDFDEALQALSQMSEPRWRRPNESGNWGIVRATSWVAMEESDLRSLK
ncbi:hypothetical protein [Devosia naphthalenivorans]|uniref:hypothetical protein n=1 Tax=Devosia naphthalenivorans TaxID=2082392 RepID=UPI0013B053D1|nr:hypothetical protein [Devosia naphthalenivorans]